MFEETSKKSESEMGAVVAQKGGLGRWIFLLKI